MTATFYFHVGDGDLRAEDAGTSVRIVVDNFDWTILLENRLDCARWMKALADADALFIRRKAADVSLPGLGAQGEPATGAPGPLVNTGQGHTREPLMCALPDDCPLGPEPHEFVPPAGIAVMCCCKQPWEDDLEPLPPLPQRKPAGPPEPLELVPATGEDGSYSPAFLAALCGEDEDEPQPGGTIYPDLTPDALAGGVPLESLAPEQEDEAEA